MEIFIGVVLLVLYTVCGIALEANHIIEQPAYWAMYGAIAMASVLFCVVLWWNKGDKR